jgi:hypothetical protein
MRMAVGVEALEHALYKTIWTCHKTSYETDRIHRGENDVARTV